MRPIKFRGRDVHTGEVIYGALRIIGINPHIYKEAHCYYEEELIEVDPDSVAQLVGYDANGKEVYEGDTVVDRKGRTWLVDYRDDPASIALHTLSQDWEAANEASH